MSEVDRIEVESDVVIIVHRPKPTALQYIVDWKERQQVYAYLFKSPHGHWTLSLYDSLFPDLADVDIYATAKEAHQVALDLGHKLAGRKVAERQEDDRGAAEITALFGGNNDSEE